MKKPNENVLVPVLSLSTLILFSSCGGKSVVGGETSNQPFSMAVSSQFVDAPVVGLTYSVEGSQSNGRTASQGRLSCNRGEIIRFEIGQAEKGLLLGTAPCSDKIFIHNLDTAIDNDAVGKIGAILQTVAPPSGSSASDSMTIPDTIADLDFDSAGLPRTINAAIADAAGATEPDALVTGLAALPTPIVVTPINVSSAQTHISSSLVNFITGDVLSTLFQLSGGQNAARSDANFANTSLRENDFNIDVTASEAACSNIELDFYIGVYKSGSQYRTYAYAAYDNDEYVGDDTSRPTICTRLGHTNYEDGECYGYSIGDQMLTSDDLTIRSTIKDVDGYLAGLNDAAPVNLNDAQDLFVSSGSVKVVEDKIKGRIILDKVSGAPTGLPSKCTFNIDHSLYGENSSDNGQYPTAAVGVWTGTTTYCSHPANYNISASGTNAANEISIGMGQVVDYILSTSAHQVGLPPSGAYTQTSWSGSQWVVTQQYESGSFRAVFVSPSNFTYTFTKTPGNYTCSGSFTQ